MTEQLTTPDKPNQGQVALPQGHMQALFYPAGYINEGARLATPEEVESVMLNKPFGDLLTAIAEEQSKKRSPEEASKMAQEFLHREFRKMEGLNVDYSLDADNKSKIDEALARFTKHGISGQINEVTKASARMEKIQRAFCLLRDHGILNGNSFLHVNYLPEIMTAAPVWFSACGEGYVGTYCNYIQTQEMSGLFSLYNPNQLPTVEEFSGDDIIPLRILDMLEAGKIIFDDIAIATPYLDRASARWKGLSQRRNVDPYLLGFIRGFNYFFILGRWSATGNFPLFPDMVADTMNHLKMNQTKISQINLSEVFTGKKSNFSAQGISATAQDILTAYSENRLFDFLRGEKNPESKTT